MSCNFVINLFYYDLDKVSNSKLTKLENFFPYLIIGLF